MQTHHANPSPSHTTVTAPIRRRFRPSIVALVIGAFVLVAGMGTAVAVAQLAGADGFGEGY